MSGRLRIIGFTGMAGAVLALWLAISVHTASGADAPAAPPSRPGKVALLPLRMNAENEMLYLRDGIYDMLSSRLFIPEGFIPLSRQTVMRLIPAAPVGVTEASARDLGRRLGADFILFGSVSALGRGVSIDLKVVDVSGKRPAQGVFDQAGEADGIIACVDRLAGDIRNWLLERPQPVSTAAREEVPRPAAKTPDAADPLRHPEDMFRQEGARRANAAAGGFPETLGAEERLPVRESPPFADRFQGLALGDIDGDGRQEVVVATPRRVLVFARTAQGLSQLYEFGQSDALVNAGVDVADIDGNGIPEIFITAVAPEGRSPRSFVLEFDKGVFRKKVDAAPWYFRVNRLAGGSRVLLGQEPAPAAGAHVGGGIFELTWRNDRYEPRTRLLAAAAFNVLGLSLGWTGADGRPLLAALDPEHRVRIYTADGGEIWRSAHAYAACDSMPAGLPARLVALPAGNSAPAQLIVARSSQGDGADAGEGSRIFAFSRDGLSLATQWIAAGIPGRIRDFAVEEAGSGAVSILAAVLGPDPAESAGGWRSSLVALEMPPPAPSPPAPARVETASRPVAVNGEAPAGEAPPAAGASRVEPAARKPTPAPSPAPPASAPEPAPAAVERPVSAARSKTWTLHVASMRNEAYARQMVDQLRRQGFAAAIEKADIPGKGIWFRVLAGEFASREEAQGAMERLRSEGHAPMLFPTRNGR